MRCPHCHQHNTQVKDSRPTENGTIIRRRRLCPACRVRFTTFERVHIPELHVRKKDGRLVSFDRDKLTRSIRIALRKRPIAAERTEQMIADLLNSLESMGKSTLESARIGQMVMDALQKLDSVAYVRFASVYKDFRTPADFREFAHKLEGGLPPPKPPAE